MTPPLRTRISGERLHERGATFIEFALILPLLVLIIFFLLEIGRYMALYSTLNIGADQAVGLASKIEGLDGTPGTADYDAAFNTVLAKAQEPGLAGFLTPNLGQGSATLRSINLSVPVPTGGESVAQAMMDEPIRLTMEAELRPVIPLFPTWPIRIIAESFREQRKIASLPVPTDCNGRPQGSVGYLADPCPCPDDQFWNWDTSTCMCKVPFGASSGCGCPAGQIPTEDGWECECDAQALQCDENQFVDSNYDCEGDSCTLSCSCACRDHASMNGQGDCVCDSGFTEVEGWCDCVVSCANGMVPNENDGCQCKCPSGTVDLGNGQCGCSKPNREYQDGKCVCTLTQDACTGGRKLKGCDCKCPSGSTWNGTSCECPAGQVMEGGKCKCDSAITCSGPSYKASNCLCVCGAGASMNSSGQCVCDEGRVQEGSQCECADQSACPSGQSRNFESCQCECSASCQNGETDPLTCGCLCPEGRVAEGNECVCSEAVPCPSGQVRNPSTCACSCASGTVEYSGQCVTSDCFDEIQNCGTTPTIQPGGSCWCDE